MYYLALLHNSPGDFTLPVVACFLCIHDFCPFDYKSVYSNSLWFKILVYSLCLNIVFKFQRRVMLSFWVSWRKALKKHEFLNSVKKRKHHLSRNTKIDEGNHSHFNQRTRCNLLLFYFLNSNSLTTSMQLNDQLETLNGANITVRVHDARQLFIKYANLPLNQQWTKSTFFLVVFWQRSSGKQIITQQSTRTSRWVIENWYVEMKRKARLELLRLYLF